MDATSISNSVRVVTRCVVVEYIIHTFTSSPMQSVRLTGDRLYRNDPSAAQTLALPNSTHYVHVMTLRRGTACGQARMTTMAVAPDIISDIIHKAKSHIKCGNSPYSQHHLNTHHHDSNPSRHNKVAGARTTCEESNEVRDDTSGLRFSQCVPHALRKP